MLQAIPQTRWNTLYYQAPYCGSFYWLYRPVPKESQYLIQREPHQDQGPVVRLLVRRRASRHKLKVQRKRNVAGEIYKAVGVNEAGKIFKAVGENEAGKIFKADGARGVGKIFR
jgi:hypothetical protein